MEPQATSGVFDVRDHGAVGDGQHDDTDAILAAVEAAGNHGIVHFGRGRFRITRKIVLPYDQTWRGVGIADTGTNTGKVPENCILTDVADDYAIEARYNTTLEHLQLRGQDRGTCLLAHGRVRLDDVTIQNYERAIHAKELWYGHFSALRLYRNKLGIQVTHCFNLNLVEPRFTCVDRHDRPMQAMLCEQIAEVKVFGGAIENYAIGIEARDETSVHFYSTYFESSPPARSYGTLGGATLVKATDAEKTTIGLVGCHVFLHNTLCVVDASGRHSEVDLLGLHNHFLGGNQVDSGVGHVAYRWTNGSRVRAHLLGDVWAPTFLENARYLEPGARAHGNSMIVPPPGSMPDARDDLLLTGAHVVLDGAPVTLGNVEALPAFSGEDRARHRGAVVFHAPSNRPVVWNGAAWTFFDGQLVPRGVTDRFNEVRAAAADVPLGPLASQVHAFKRFWKRMDKRLRTRMQQRRHSER